MNDNVKKWTAALRSGEYAQAEGVLRDSNDAFCCLGVACDVYAKEVGGEWREGGFFRAGSGETLNDTSKYALPGRVREWLGLDDASGQYEGAALIDHNDDDKLPFDQIADIIESEPDGLFV